MSLEYVYWVGPEIMCGNICEIWMESVGTVVKRVFWGKFKMAENLWDANGRGLHLEMRHDPRNPGEEEF